MQGARHDTAKTFILISSHRSMAIHLGLVIYPSKNTLDVHGTRFNVFKDCDTIKYYGIIVIAAKAPKNVHYFVEFLERNSKAKRNRAASAYSRALRRIKGVVQKIVHGKWNSPYYDEVL